MTKKRASRLAVWVACALVLSGCTVSQIPTATPTATKKPTTAEQLNALRDNGYSLGQLLIHSDGASAWVARKGETQLLSLYEDPFDPKPKDFPTAEVSWDIAEPTQLAAHIDDGAAKCSADYEIRVTAITASAYLSTFSCPRFTDPNGVYLNQQPLHVLRGQWTVEDWRQLVQEWNTLSPSRSFLGVRIDEERITVYLAPKDGTHTCTTPATIRNLDSTDISVNCSSEYGGTTFSFDGLTGEMLAEATAKALKTLDATAKPGIKFNLEAAKGGGIQFSVSTDKGANHQILLR